MNLSPFPNADCRKVDELRAHVFLEKFDETLTVREMRAKLRETGAIGENERPTIVPLTHYLLFRYNGTCCPTCKGKSSCFVFFFFFFFFFFFLFFFFCFVCLFVCFLFLWTITFLC